MMPFNPRFYTYVHHAGKKASLTVPLYAHRNGGTGGASESIGIGAKYDPSKDFEKQKLKT